MKLFLSENRNKILLLLLLSLLFLLWGRTIARSFRENDKIHDLSSVQARVLCAERFGWEADPSTETKEKVWIPPEFDAVYEEYNKLQKMCGFDLTPYRGKAVMRYRYQIQNFPFQTDEPIFIHLYLYQDKMIAGDCMTRAADGFMLPIDRRFAP